MFACLLALVSSMSLSIIAILNSLKITNCKRLECCCGNVEMIQPTPPQSPRIKIKPMSTPDDCWFSKID